MTDIESADRGMRPAVDATLSALALTPADAAAARLCERYADQLDRASTTAAMAARAARKAGDDVEMAELVAALRAKLAERVAWADLGPRLAALLGDLGATPRARAQIAARVPTPKEPQRAGRLAGLRSVHGAKTS